ncbi:MAG: MCP four helix bundle domain-containing protein, partial [Chloroflexota bacterium]
MRGISIRWLFFISFVVIVLLTALVGFLDARATQQVLDEFTEVTDVSAQSVIALTQANTAAFRAQTEAISVTFLGEEEEEAEEEEAEFEEAAENAAFWLAEFNRVTSTEREEELATAMQAMIDASFELIELSEEGAAEAELLEQKEIMEDAEDAYTDVLAEILALDQQRFDASRNEAVATANRARTVSISVVGLLAVGSVGIAFFLASQTVTPVIHLKERAIHIA